MAYDGPHTSFVAVKAAADITNMYRFGVVTATGVEVANVAGERVHGVIYEKPKAGEPVKLAFGQVQVEASAAIAVGDLIATAADGRAKVATLGTLSDGTVAGTKGDYVCGFALTAAAAAGEMITVLVVPLGINAF